MPSRYSAGIAVDQDQQVDVRVGVEFAAPVAADGEQRDVLRRVRLGPFDPRLHRSLISSSKNCGAPADDRIDVFAGPESLSEQENRERRCGVGRRSVAPWDVTETVLRRAV